MVLIRIVAFECFWCSCCCGCCFFFNGMSLMIFFDGLHAPSTATLDSKVFVPATAEKLEISTNSASMPTGLYCRCQSLQANHVAQILNHSILATWWFPKIEVPPFYHPFLDGFFQHKPAIFHDQPTILGCTVYPILRTPPPAMVAPLAITVRSSDRCDRRWRGPDHSREEGWWLQGSTKHSGDI